MAIIERLDECDRMCAAITEARVSDAAQHDLKGLLHRDMMYFCVYLSLQDREFTAAQRAYVAPTSMTRWRWAIRRRSRLR